MTIQFKPMHRNLMLGVALASLAACGNVRDWDMRNLGGGFNTTNAAAQATMRRPAPDSQGIISYPGYQVAVARSGDTVTTIANRLGLSPQAVAQYNAIGPNTPLTPGAVIALPNRVGANGNGNGTTAPASGGQIDITSLANGAINRATTAPGQGLAGANAAGTGGSFGATGTAGNAVQGQTLGAANGAVQPIRHRVKRGETAYSIARLYNIPVRALADWNGLGPDLKVHQGQVLLIPVTQASAQNSAQATAQANASATTLPGQPSPVPAPPSASQPLPSSNPPPANAPVQTPPSPNLGQSRTSASAAQYMMPVNGKVIRGFSSKNQGIDISAPVGSPVRAATAGTVAAITKDTKNVPIVVIRDSGNRLTVYANIDNLRVKKGETVKAGQVIGEIRAGRPPFMHFEVRNGLQAIDPMTVLQ